MVLNQELAISIRRCLRIAGAVSMLGLAAGCQTSGGIDKAEEAPAPIAQSTGDGACHP